MYLTLNLLIVPLKLMNLLTGLNLKVYFESGPVWAVSLSQQDPGTDSKGYIGLGAIRSGSLTSAN